jgi:UDP-N-acetylglucosamine 4,6-dehydratase/5-epimerase
MTRFCITLDHGVQFVLNSFERMQGGEIFVPKIPSMRVVDLANALAPKLPIKVIGIRPGEKLHEIMCPTDDSHLTIEFKGHYVICPAIRYSHNQNYLVDVTGEVGKRVPVGFEYHSANNYWWLTCEEMVSFCNTSVVLEDQTSCMESD